MVYEEQRKVILEIAEKEDCVIIGRNFNWIFVIRLPDFITKEDFKWAVETATKKKKLDCSLAEFMTIDEGLCIEIMHLGAYKIVKKY